MILSGIEVSKFQGKYYRIINESIWMLIMRHNCENGDKYKGNKALYNTRNLNKYSVISKINPNTMKINGKYEFLAEYPNYQKGYNHWRQTNNPIHEEETATNVSGFEPIHTDIYNWFWCGLSKSSNTNTLLDGTNIKGNWNYAFGTYVLYDEYVPTNIDHGTKDLFLWLKLPSISSIQTLRSTVMCKRNSSSFILIALLPFLSSRQ